ncbi:MAG: PEP-CTERM system histidine kinase PrsK [Gammaproteobacteria bacterium]
MNIGTISYSIAAVFFLGLSALLLTSWRGRLHGALLLLAVVLSAAWAAVAAVASDSQAPWLTTAYYVLEVLRDAGWFAFLFQLLALIAPDNARRPALLRIGQPTVFGIVALVLVIDAMLPVLPTLVQFDRRVDLTIVGHLALAVIGLGLVEQLFRNTNPDRRWAVKYLFVGIGALFAYDFFFYANALLFRRIDHDLWVARGIINAMTVPMLAVSAARNPDWSLDVFVSRRIVLHVTSLLGAGLYLLGMAGAGYYIRIFGGRWGTAAQAIFLFLALLLLFVLLFSGQMRARVKVFLSKHFFNYKYDYRDEWLKLLRTLTSMADQADMRERVIRALADIVDSPGGILWTRTESGRFQHAAHWNYAEDIQGTLSGDASLVRFLHDRQWIVDLHEYEREPEGYQGLSLPDWLRNTDRAWLVVPLIQNDELLAFIVLANSRAPRQINWEDRDLLKTVGLQLASYVALLTTTEALMNARQFEAFNRLSSYVVHDLKNIAAQLGLVVSNAARHIDNPEFVKDAIRTVDNATTRMNRMLAQFRKGKGDESGKEIIELAAVLREAVAMCKGREPAAELLPCEPGLLLLTERDRLVDVLGHLIENAQDATGSDGTVRVRGFRSDENVTVEIADTGCGMDEQFIRERLFRPFDTTKGNAGMGIGVFESREFVWGHGGDIAVTSVKGKGTTFRITLPLYADAPSEKVTTEMFGTMQ